MIVLGFSIVTVVRSGGGSPSIVVALVEPVAVRLARVQAEALRHGVDRGAAPGSLLWRTNRH